MQYKTSFGKYLRMFPLTTVCVIIVWYLCLFKPPSVRIGWVPGFDKFVHITMYLGTCGVFWLEYFRNRLYWTKSRLLTVAVIAPILMSGLIELAQDSLTTYRSADWFDFAANSFGVLLACAGAIVWRKIGKGRCR